MVCLMSTLLRIYKFNIVQQQAGISIYKDFVRRERQTFSACFQYKDSSQFGRCYVYIMQNQNGLWKNKTCKSCRSFPGRFLLLAIISSGELRVNVNKKCKKIVGFENWTFFKNNCYTFWRFTILIYFNKLFKKEAKVSITNSVSSYQI